MFPIIRNRRLRTTASIRRLVRETTITTDDFLVPLFVVEGKGIKEEIPSMPNYFRLSLDELEKEIKSLWEMGLCGVLLFVKVPDHLKDNEGKEPAPCGRLHEKTPPRSHRRNLGNARRSRRSRR